MAENNNNKCPKCGYELEVHTATSPDAPKDATPEPGDFTVCFKCATILEFTDDLSLKIPTTQAIEKTDKSTREILEKSVYYLNLLNPKRNK